MNGWFKLPGSKSQGHYIEKDRLYQLLRDDIESIRMKLSGEPYANRIMRKIQTAHEIGVTDRFRFFFEEIGLKLEQNEWNAINARHEYAHGGIVFGQTDWEHLILDAQTYENVFHKIVLKVLGYSGSYIDRSSIP
jgi:hypothetical protein